MITWILIFIVSLVVLVKSADFFTENSKKLGIAIGMPDFIVGVIIVSVGTSLPELITSLFAVLNGSTEFVAGNVVGSNIANIFLVLGIASIIAEKFVIKWDLLKIDVPILLGSALLIYLTTLDGIFGKVDAIFCLLGFVIYANHSYVQHKEAIDNIKKKKKAAKLKWKYPAYIFISGIGIYFGADYLIKSVIKLTEIFGFGDTSVMALTVVAVGTSLPELFVSGIAAYKGDYEIAIGNVIGSNIFNTFIVLPIPALISNLVIPTSITSIGVPFMLAATIFYIISTLDKEVTRYEGYISLVIYALFTWMLFN